MMDQNTKYKLESFNKIIRKKAKTESGSEMVRLITLSAMAEKYFRENDQIKFSEIFVSLDKELMRS